MLDVAATGDTEESATPVLARLRGSLRTGSVEDYRRHLVRKHR